MRCEAEAAAKALRAAGAKHIYLAGRPGEREAAFTAAGIGSFIYVGCDVVAMLKAAHAVLAIPEAAPSSGERFGRVTPLRGRAWDHRPAACSPRRP